jgi:peroxiredoxin
MPLLDSLAPITVETPDGATRPLGDVLGGKRTVLVFIRHYGCIFCREQVDRFKTALPHIHGRGYELIVIGQGRAAHARAFVDESHIDFPVYADSSLEAFQAAGLRRSVARTMLDPRVWWRALGAIKDGFSVRRVAGDPWQNGGVFVIDGDGNERFRHISRFAGDHPPMDAVIGALV